MYEHWKSYGAEEVLRSGGQMIFPGGDTLDASQADMLAREGFILCHDRFGSKGGELSGSLKLHDTEGEAECEFILHHDPRSGFMLTAGLACGRFCVRYGLRGEWTCYKSTAANSQLKSGVFSLGVKWHDDVVRLIVDGAELIAAEVPFAPSNTHVGMRFASRTRVVVQDFDVLFGRRKAFAVMQFSEEYAGVYKLIKRVCAEFGSNVIRADESRRPGLIITEIENQIKNATFVLAEITPPSPNVYLEVGYALALKKPIIFLARQDTKLPFDVRGHNVFFYRNDAGGMSGLEMELRLRVEEALSTSGV
jgi:hypothetical protein